MSSCALSKNSKRKSEGRKGLGGEHISNMLASPYAPKRPRSARLYRAERDRDWQGTSALPDFRTMLLSLCVLGVRG